MLRRVLYIGMMLLVVMAGCKSGQSGGETDGKTTEGQSKTPPRMDFEQVFYDFGNITQGEKVSYSFEFENTGGSPLVIEDAFASCGCTVPEYDKEPLAPGNKSLIEVIFDSSGRRGNQYKTVILKTNTPEGKHRLTIKANVLMN